MIPPMIIIISPTNFRIVKKICVLATRRTLIQFVIPALTVKQI